MTPKQVRADFARQRKSLTAALVERDGLCCHYCGIWLIPPGTAKTDNWYYRTGENGEPRPRSSFALLNVDHINPISKGGGNELKNLVLACMWCNSRRKDRDYEPFYKAHMHRRMIPTDVYDQMFSSVQGKTFDVD